METETTNTSDASSAIQPTQQTFDQFFIFDGGDVEIKAIFQGHKVKGKVASQAMVLASPIKTIGYTEVDGFALLILLRLAHLQSTTIPPKIGIDTLFQVSIQCEKYDCSALLHLILPTWLAAEEDEAAKGENGKWLYICWAFGLETLFKEAALRIAKSAQVLQGELLTSGGIKFSEPMPDKATETIMSIRIETVHAILDLVYKKVKKYSDIKSLTTILCKHGRLSCDAINTAALSLAFNRDACGPQSNRLECYSE
ncbi:hypothetical protein IFR05_005951 [Cadophora sp. M221]|nr:hypothetical protein IFR05_005951 [Cadophora sp. M221]